MTGGQKALVAFFGIGIVGTAIYLYMSKKGKSVAETVNDQTLDPAIQPTDSSGGKTPASVVAPSVRDSFPLNVGSRGPRVAQLQTAIINKFNVGVGGGADGVFGNRTQEALRKIGYAAPISEADFGKIIAGVRASAATSMPNEASEIALGDSIFAAKDGVPIYTYPKAEAKYAARDASRIPYQFNLSTNRIGAVSSRIQTPDGARWLEISVDRLGGKKHFVRFQDVKKTAF